MIRSEDRDVFATRYHRPVTWFGYLITFAVALRRIAELDEAFSIGFAAVALVVFAILYGTQRGISRRHPAYIPVYFALQVVLVQFLGIFQTYQDTWPLLYLVLAFQAAHLPKKAAIFWWGLFALLSLMTLAVEFGPLAGPGPALIYIAIGAIYISYDIQYGHHEDALAESQVLLSELQEAHQKLEQHLAQAEELSAAQERNRVAQELYDSVGQKVFAIQLAAETVRLKLQKESPDAVEALEELQQQTQAVLAQMRQLILEWRPRNPDISN